MVEIFSIKEPRIQKVNEGFEQVRSGESKAENLKNCLRMLKIQQKEILLLNSYIKVLKEDIASLKWFLGNAKSK